MIHLTIRRVALRIRLRTPLLLTLLLSLVAGFAFAATVGDQVELKATHPAGVPFYNAPGGGQTFQRVPG
jgi:hypothetical protein